MKFEMQGQSILTAVNQLAMMMCRTLPETLMRHLCRYGSAETFGPTASVFDDNLIDGHDLTDSFILSLHLLHCSCSQSSLSKCFHNTTVQVPSAMNMKYHLAGSQIDEKLHYSVLFTD